MSKVLVVVDMQNDFISGSLGTKEAQNIVGNVVGRIKECKEQGYDILVTLDTHGEDYMSTQEGKKLPVEHCIKGTVGWELAPEVAEAVKGCKQYEKETFGSKELVRDLVQIAPEEIEFIGLCTDICVVSNVLLTKAWLTEIPLVVDSMCCAGVTQESHEAALNTMASCQVEIRR